MADETDDPRQDTAQWCAIALDQAARLEEAVETYVARLYESQVRFHIHDDRRVPDEDPLAWGDVWRMAGERYFLLMAVGQIRKCVDLQPADNLPRLTNPRVVQLLRNVEEHWEQDVTDPKAWSLRELRQTEPDASRGWFAINKHGTWLSEEVTVDDLVTWVQKVDVAVRAKSAEAGNPLPAAADVIR